ncbi:calx-beta domain-containing protein [Reticulomyxa filosa]|uniref:Calx-beta domain-containing protein n=1 Tax=Reticulomyxa filosa TaxID=46433 RepID=X6NMD0_RETFI|nr:calx-beta domain-containing protein [Reticulomyxa filosa]|eukprot:ETO27176.1 calx-beta domain-containing protein [Reticulomyxa filosa]
MKIQPDGSFEIVSSHSEQVLDINQRSKECGVIVQQWPSIGEKNQRFELCPVLLPQNHYNLELCHSGLLLDVQEDTSRRSKRAVQCAMLEGKSQLFTIVMLDDGYCLIKHIYSDSALTIQSDTDTPNEGAKVILRKYNANKNKKKS